jgi:hypothetical protein
VNVVNVDVDADVVLNVVVFVVVVVVVVVVVDDVVVVLVNVVNIVNIVVIRFYTMQEFDLKNGNFVYSLWKLL